MTDADRQVHHDLIHEQRRSRDERIGVGFQPDPISQVLRDASGTDEEHA
jgi:hypothetical protein